MTDYLFQSLSRKFLRATIRAFPLAPLILLCACSASTPVEPEATELTDKKNGDDKEISSEGLLFNNSKRLYSTGLYTVAKDSFERLSTNFPTGAYAEFAEVKIGDAQFQASDYSGAALQYEQFFQNHPSSKSVPYTLFRLAQSYELSQRGIGRDSAPLEKALSAVDKLLTHYPESAYAPPARALRERVLTKLADYEKLVRDFYVKREAPGAVKAREAVVESKWAPLLRKATEESNDFKPTIVAARAVPFPVPAIVTIEREESRSAFSGPFVSPISAKEKAAAPTDSAPTIVKVEATNPSSSPSAPYSIQKVACADSTISLYLNKLFEEGEFLSNNQTLTAIDGVIKLKIPDIQSKAITLNCSGVGNVSVSEKGEITLATQAQQASLLSLDFPPRLLLLVSNGE